MKILYIILLITLFIIIYKKYLNSIFTTLINKSQPIKQNITIQPNITNQPNIITQPTYSNQNSEVIHALFVLEKNDSYPLNIIAYLSNTNYRTYTSGFSGHYNNIKELIADYNKYDDNTIIPCSGQCSATKNDYLQIKDKRNPSILLYPKGNILQKLIDDYYSYPSEHWTKKYDLI